MKALYNEARVELRTPEGMEFALPLAGPASRMLALAVDLFVVGVAGSVLQSLTKALAILSVDFALALMVVSYFVVSMLYGILCEWKLQGQTIGKRLLRIRVMDRDGLPIAASQIIVRNLLRPVDMLPVCYLVGGALAVITRHGQRLGDLAANTVVVRADGVGLPDIRNLFAGKYNSLLDYPHLMARLRQRATPELAGVALDALLRRESLEAVARLRIFAELAERFRTLVEFPPEAVESVSDEQYVRNVAEVLYRRR